MKTRRSILFAAVLVVLLSAALICVCWLRVPGSRIVSWVENAQTGSSLITCVRSVVNGEDEEETAAISLTGEQLNELLAQLSGKSFLRMDSERLPYASEVRYTILVQDENGQTRLELVCQGADWIKARTYTDAGAEENLLSVQMNSGMASEWAASLEALF